MSTWLKPQDYPLPDTTVGMTDADFMLAYNIRSRLMNADANFLTSGDPEYSSPQAFLENFIAYAVSLTQNNFIRKYAPPSWNAVGQGFKYAYSCFDWLKQLPVNIGDPNTASVYDAWVAGKGALYGGHDPIPVTPVSNLAIPGASPANFGTIFTG